jgi:hypothetical protein
MWVYECERLARGNSEECWFFASFQWPRDLIREKVETMGYDKMEYYM